MKEWAWLGWFLAGIGMGLLVTGRLVLGAVVGLVGFVLAEVFDDGARRRR